MGEFHKHSMKQKVNETTQQENKVIIKKEAPMQLDYDHKRVGKSKFASFKMIVYSTVIIIVLLVMGVLAYTKHMLGYVNTKSYDNKTNNVVMQEERFDTDQNDTLNKFEEINPDDVKWNNTGDIKKVKGITNVLLVSDAEQDTNEYNLRGRSDVILIATINTRDKTLKLTSIMRDTYVQIPGCRDNRINTAYRTGDIPLLEKTIEENFNISVDGYVKVNFEGFTNVIDALGGVEVTLTEAEAEWLNKGKHIIDPDSRNVEAGTHVLNGSQALGYCVIRRIDTVDGLQYDFGRVWRQKLVLTTLFNKYKDESIKNILALAPQILSNITTDIPENKILSLAMTAFDLDVNEIQTLTVPIKGSFEGKMIRGMSVLVPNLKTNIAALDAFVYGDSKRSAGEETTEVSEYEINFSLNESNFKLKSIDKYTEKAFDILKGYSKLTLRDVMNVQMQCHKN